MENGGHCDKVRKQQDQCLTERVKVLKHIMTIVVLAIRNLELENHK